MATTYNPWREFIENCISGDNYFRAQEYHDLLEYMDALIAENDAAKAHKCPTAFDLWVAEQPAGDCLDEHCPQGTTTACNTHGCRREGDEAAHASPTPAQAGAQERLTDVEIGEAWASISSVDDHDTFRKGVRFAEDRLLGTSGEGAA